MQQMEAQKSLVSAIKADMSYIRKRLEDLEKQLHMETATLVKACEEHGGHEYILERSHDCHSSRNMYTCAHCGHFTMVKPLSLKTTRNC